MSARNDRWSVLVELGIVTGLAGQIVDRQVSPLGLTPVHFGLLSVVSALGPITPTKLERASGLLPTTLRERLQVLERGGFVHRVSNPRDRRSHFVEITSDGVALMRQARSAVREIEGDLSRVLGRSVEEYRPLLEQLRAAQLAVLEGVAEPSAESGGGEAD